MGTAVSNAVVALFSEYLGRGPTRARTVFGQDFVAVVLQDTLTKAERRLADEGEGDTVLSTRRTFQKAMRHDLITVVEQLTGRHVVAFLSDHQLDPDYAVETFILDGQTAPPEGE
jgi:uncharacterized protein YbcI